MRPRSGESERTFASPQFRRSISSWPVEILREVQALPTWCATDVQALLHRLADSLPSALIEWDLGAGKEWAQVLVAGEVECLIRAPTSVGQAHRFAFLRSRPAGDGHLRPLLDAYQV